MRGKQSINITKKTVKNQAKIESFVFEEENKETKDGFGARLKQIREAYGIGLRGLAQSTGVHPSRLWKIEVGVLPPPDDHLMSALADALHQQPDCFFALACRVEPGARLGYARHPIALGRLLRACAQMKPPEVDLLVSKVDQVVATFEAKHASGEGHAQLEAYKSKD
jgi:HTH-type transcriptional regulator, competence development regulator